MDKGYEVFCLANPLFYDTPNRDVNGDIPFEATDRLLPARWETAPKDEWFICRPLASSIPSQGWKIHVSATRTNADKVLNKVWHYCVQHRISFKFLRSRLTLHMRNAKYAPRGSSGKLVTIYPESDEQAEIILRELDAIISGEPGPYILSDLRYAKGPLYVRYGGFAERYCENERGELVSAIEDGSGRLVPDVRNPVFTVPPWVSLPAFLAPHLKARNATTVAGLPYKIERALHFSNGGGVYKAVDSRTGEKVVIKEARPHAGLSGDGADAVARLQRERQMLEHLSGLDCVPAVRDYFELGEHHFLVQDFIEGDTLNTFFALRHPLLDPVPDTQKIADYTAWALRVCSGIEQATEAIHKRGVIVNDLHMFNIMVRPDDTVALFDFEVAARVDEGRRPTIGNPGFVAPRDRTGFLIDRYSLGCLRLAMFMPMTTLCALDLDKASELAEAIGENFPVPKGFLAQALKDIRGEAGLSGRSRLPKIVGDGPGLDNAARSLTRAILTSATPSRDDRLFPGDVRQFISPGGGLSLAYGAAGVLYALSQAGAGRIPAYEEWLIARAVRPEQGTRPGLYDGLLGVAYVLHDLGHAQQALKIAEIVLSEKWERLGSDLHGGLSGLALAFLNLGDACGELALSDAGERAAAIIADRLDSHGPGRHGDPQGGDAARRRTGLLYGASGPALLFIRSYERSGDPQFLDLAARALAMDLDNCVMDDNGALHVDEGWRVLPYLGEGSAGIGMVIDGYLTHRPDDDRFTSAADAIRLAALSPYYSEPGLFNGRAGMILYLSQRDPAGHAADDADVAAHVRRLAWHAIRYRGGLAFPGKNLYRLSMDLGTGTAGILLAIGTVSGRAGLPFLGAAAAPAAAAPIQTPPGRPSKGTGKQHGKRR